MTTCRVRGSTRVRIIDWVSTWLPENLASLSEPSSSTVKGWPETLGSLTDVGAWPGPAVTDGLGPLAVRLMCCPVSCRAVVMAGKKYATAPAAPATTKPNATPVASRIFLRQLRRCSEARRRRGGTSDRFTSALNGKRPHAWL